MSWFDTSSFSSFAKTALSQAQNLQKSIDKVLDIPDETGDTAAKSSGKHIPALRLHTFDYLFHVTSEVWDVI